MSIELFCEHISDLQSAARGTVFLEPEWVQVDSRLKREKDRAKQVMHTFSNSGRDNGRREERGNQWKS